MTSPSQGVAWSRLVQLLGVFLKLGLVGYGGPAVTVAMIQDEAVARRAWLSQETFLDILGITNLIPGPNATEVAIYVGYTYAGRPGMIVAGVAFILPGAVLSGVLGWFYLRYGALPALQPLLVGIKPAVLSVIAMAVVRLGLKAIASWTCALIGVMALAASLLGADEITALVGAALLGALLLSRPSPGATCKPNLALVWPLSGVGLWPLATAAARPVGLWSLFLFFLKVGALLYGGGYVLIAFLQGGLVEQYGWMTQAQLLDAIAVGQFTPGPLSSTSTFIGYLLGGVAGAGLATLGMFLPSFLLVSLVVPWVPTLRRSVWASRFLDAAAISAVGLMAGVAVKLGLNILTSWSSLLIATIAGLVAWRTKLNSAWLALGGALLGWALSWLG